MCEEVFTPEELAELSAKATEPYIFARDSEGNLITKKKSKE